MEEGRLSSIWGIPQRKATDSERQFFLQNIKVGGYASPDNNIVLNPFAPLLPDEQNAVAHNEAIRVLLRQNPDIKPKFNFTDQQNQQFANYSPNKQDQYNTVFARLITNDPSANGTAEQKQYANQLFSNLLKGGNYYRENENE